MSSGEAGGLLGCLIPRTMPGQYGNEGSHLGKLVCWGHFMGESGR